jgi:hypothetical protein
VTSADPLISEPTSLFISAAQARVVRVLMGLIMFLTGTYVGFDWAGFFYHFTSPYPARAGYARTVLCALLVWLIRGARVDRRDALLLGAAFAVTLVADFFLILEDWMIPGTVLFLVVHALLIARHLRGLYASLAPAQRTRSLRLYALTALVAYGGAVALILTVKPILERTHSLALDSVYLLFLSTSMWAAWGTLIRDYYPLRNAWYVVVGMTCFFFCDVTVGISASLSGTQSGAVLNNMVGLFYSPALVLIAYSGYHWHSRSQTRAVG